MNDSFVNKLFAAAKEKGFADCEIYYVNGSSFSLKVFNGEIHEYKNAGDTGLAFRGTFNGKMGYSFTEKTSDEIIPFLVDNAAQNAEIIEDSDIENLFVGSETYPMVKTFEESLSKVSTNDKIEMAFKMEKTAKDFDSRVEAIDYCGLATVEGEVAIVNSLGLNVRKKSNFMTAYCYPRVSENGQTKMSGDSWIGKNASEFNPEQFGENAAKLSLSCLCARSVPTGRYKILFTREAMSDLLEAFIGIFSAEKVQKGFSLLKGKIGQKVSSAVFNVRDDALLPDLPGSTPFDSEGVAAMNKSIIENGVLKTFLHNRKTAKKDGVEPTGNGFKGSFKSPVGVSPTNFYVVPGTKTENELISEMENGIIISDLSGLHSGTNSVSGDFSISAEGFYVENGKKTFAVEQITIAGNFFTLIKDILAVGNDLRFMGSVNSPCVIVREINVAGL